jgi:hypothetical protein
LGPIALKGFSSTLAFFFVAAFFGFFSVLPICTHDRLLIGELPLRTSAISKIEDDETFLHQTSNRSEENLGMGNTIASQSAANPSASSKRLLPWLVAVAFFMESLDTTILNTAVPAISAALGVAPLSRKFCRVSSSILALNWHSDSIAQFGPGYLLVPPRPYFEDDDLIELLSLGLSMFMMTTPVSGLELVEKCSWENTCRMMSSALR